MTRRRGLALLLALELLWLALAPAATAEPITNAQMQATWARTDQPVANLVVHRTWMWGPEATTGLLQESYAEAPGGQRTVQYFDKSRMEITHPDGDQNSIWYVTNGLLAKELITGTMQVGDNTFEPHQPAQVNVAGDPNDPDGPTYATFHDLMGAPPLTADATITQTVNRAGQVGDDGAFARLSVTAQDVGAPTQHTVASVFWAFMNASGPVQQGGQVVTDTLFQNPFYATGYPLTEAYWTQVKVGGVAKQVLVQVFERRVLTYTPDNPAGWTVETGNVGQHYYTWRYGRSGDNPAAPSTPEAPGNTENPAPPGNPGNPGNPGTPSTGSPTPTPTGDAGEAACLNTTEQQFLTLLNAYRQQNNLGPLVATKSLNVASYDHSLDMGQRAYFDHNTKSPLPPGASGPSPFDRMKDAGYPTSSPQQMAENIAAGYRDAQSVFDGWKNSAGHNANMLNPGFKSIGIGLAIVQGSPYTYYWTTDFGGVVDAAPSCS